MHRSLSLFPSVRVCVCKCHYGKQWLNYTDKGRRPLRQAYHKRPKEPSGRSRKKALLSNHVIIETELIFASLQSILIKSSFKNLYSQGEIERVIFYFTSPS